MGLIFDTEEDYKKWLSEQKRQKTLADNKAKKTKGE